MALPGGGASRGRPISQAPAVQAALIQLFAFLLVLALAYGVPLPAGMEITIAMATVLQGAVAAALSRARGLASWWLPIQALFPVALVGGLSLQLPPAIFLGVFVLLLAWYWSTFRTQVPFYPSGPAVREAVAALLPADRPVRFIDIGSGLGGLVIHLAGQRPQDRFTGIELAPLPWLASAMRGRFRRSGARFMRGDYERLDLGAYDVVFAYLSPAAMPSLWRKASAEMRKDSLLLSYEFAIPGVVPEFSIRPADDGPLLYGWRV